jgi:hypothetical protein
MNGKSKVSGGWKIGLLWVTASTVGFAAGMAGSLLARGRLSETAAALVFGLVSGLAQWLAVRKLFRPAGWWLAANGLGIPLGFAASNALQRLLLWSGPSLLDQVIGIGIPGILVGMAQWLVLRRHFRKAGWWVPLSTAGWLLGGWLTWVIQLQLPAFIDLCTRYALVGLVVGTGTGLGLMLLRRSPVPMDAKPSKPGVGVALAVCVTALLLMEILVENRINSLGSLPDLESRPACNHLPPLECVGDDAYCSALVPFEPVHGAGYSNDPVIGETWENQYRSFLRRDLMMAIQYAAARVYCQTGGWDDSPLAILGLGDMSEADGAIPGTSIGYPGHPMGTHQWGNDIDVAYYQGGAASARLEADASSMRPVCKHTEFGIFVWHCTEPPRLFDAWRTALFIASLAEHPLLRVIGVDGQAGPVIEAALDGLVQAGWVDASLRSGIPLSYETVDEGMGWYLYHFHHMHISMKKR